jgi:hypothetical protein
MIAMTREANRSGAVGSTSGMEAYDKYIDSLYATFIKKRPLNDTSTRSAYVYVALGKAVRPSDLSDENLIPFFSSLSPEERRGLFNMVFSLESPKLHYLTFKALQEKLNVSSKERSYYSIHDAYCYALSLISRLFYRTFTRDYFHSYSLFVADFVSISEALGLPTQDFSDLVQDLSPTKQKIQEELEGELFFYPRRINGSWKLVRHGDFVSMAPKEEGDIPKFFYPSVSII